jgi:MFS transporter, PAT family, beta-lactamase induction signal transducer AmpG
MPLRRKLAWVAVLYFAEGFPFGIVFDNLPVYFRVHGVSLGDIGLMGLLGLPWTLKVVWAPLVDRFGRKRTWISAALGVIAIVLAVLPHVEVGADLRVVWILLLCLTIASATQDIAIDAYTIGLLDRGEEGVGNGIRVSAYRAALIVGGGGLLALADRAGWTVVFGAAAAIAAVLAVTLAATPPISAESAPRSPWLPALADWLRRPGAIFVFLFVLTYKLGDASMGPMVKPFWVDRGLSASEIAAVSNTLGIGLTVAGALIGGIVTSRMGIFRGLWMLGLAQAFSNLGYAGAAWLDAGRLGIYSASAVESFTAGLGTAAFLAFLMRICDPTQAATQYAALSAVFALTRTLASAASGFGAERFGYASYFAFTFVLAFPAYSFLPWIRAWSEEPRSQSDAV